MHFMFLSKPNFFAIPNCNVGFLFSVLPALIFGVRIPPLWKQEPLGIWGSKGWLRWGSFAISAAVKELWAPSTRICPRAKRTFQDNPVLWLTGNGKQLWMSQILLFPDYSNPLEDCFKELWMNKFPFQVSLGFIFLIINEFSVHLKQIKHYHWELPVGLGHFWNSCCWVYYESKGAELHNLIDIVEQKMEK